MVRIMETTSGGWEVHAPSPSPTTACQGDNSDDKTRMMSDGGGNNGAEVITELRTEAIKDEDRNDDQ